jgi:hypothetical protein
METVRSAYSSWSEQPTPAHVGASTATSLIALILPASAFDIQTISLLCSQTTIEMSPRPGRQRQSCVGGTTTPICCVVGTFSSQSHMHLALTSRVALVNLAATYQRVARGIAKQTAPYHARQPRVRHGKQDIYPVVHLKSTWMLFPTL